MYCIKCGVRLEKTEEKCPLCNTLVCHPDFTEFEPPLYPKNRLPKGSPNSKFICGAIIILFLIPLTVCLFADLGFDGEFDWFGYVAGALLVAYIALALPLWFKRANPVIFTPCNFVSLAVYLFYINFETNGNWFVGFALPLTVALGVIICTTVTLLYYLRRGKLFVVGGAVVALGVFIPLVELLLCNTFSLKVIGWSVYPLVVLLLLGGLLIYLGISRHAREIIERKFFI